MAAQRVLGYLWAYLVSNQGPLPCEGSALPLSYTPGKPDHSTRGLARPRTVQGIGRSRDPGPKSVPTETPLAG